MFSAKSYINMVAAIFIFAAALSCDKAEELQEEILATDVELTCTINNGTKASLGPGVNDTDCNVVWNVYDAIAVINEGKLYRFIISDTDANQQSGKFKLDKSYLPENYKEGDFKINKPIQAFYPYSGVHYDTLTHDITYNVPQYQQNQIYKPSESVDEIISFGQGMMPMAAYSSNAKEELVFEKLFAAVKITIEGPEDELLQSLSIVSSYNINGIASVTITEGMGDGPILSLDIQKNQEKNEAGRNYNIVSLDCDNNGISIATPVEYILTLPVKAKDLGLIITTSVDKYYQIIEKPKQDNIEEEEYILTQGKIFIAPKLNTVYKMPAYIENDVYLGDGIKLPKTPDKSEYLIWAPVNCGYVSDDKMGGHILHKGYLFGKMYQWGRKDGQGYRDIVYEDETYPLNVSSLGTSQPAAEKFYGDWELDSVQWPAESDPCPKGWRVPTMEELISLVKGLRMNDYVVGLSSQWTSSHKEESNGHHTLPGFLFFGNTTDSDKRIFLPAAGYYKHDFTGEMIRGLSGCYWSSTSTEPGKAWYMDFNRKGYIDTYYDKQACGRSVRCVKEEIKKEQTTF